jgi:hypothetical protein
LVAGNGTILALFIHVDDLLCALRRLKEGKHIIRTVFSPLPVPEVPQILGTKASAVRVFVLLGAATGGLGLVSLAVYAHLSFSLITGGKPVLPWIAWVVVCFEGAILGGVVSAAVSWILKGRLPRLTPIEGYDGAFSRDRFGVLVGCTPNEVESVKELLREEGAEEVRHVP